jgi:hypothetical protein
MASTYSRSPPLPPKPSHLDEYWMQRFQPQHMSDWEGNDRRPTIPAGILDQIRWRVEFNKCAVPST